LIEVYAANAWFYRHYFSASEIKVHKIGATFVRKATIGETLQHLSIKICALGHLPNGIFPGKQDAPFACTTPINMMNVRFCGA
jgi:hypothetical protein